MQKVSSVGTVGSGRNGRRWKIFRSASALGLITMLLTLILLDLKCDLDNDGVDENVHYPLYSLRLGRGMDYTLQASIRGGASEHRWELPGNYHDFIGVLIFYLFCRRTKRIIVTTIICYKFIYISSN